MTRTLMPLLAVALAACGPGKKIRPTTDEKVEITDARVERGEYLVNGIAACGACHNGYADGTLGGPNVVSLLGGGNEMIEPELKVRLYVPNITSDPETGVGSWSDDELIRAIRDGVRPDDTVLFPVMPYGAYQHMSDDDARSIVAYLRSIPPAKPVLPRFENEMPGIFKMAIKSGMTLHDPAVDVPAPDMDDQVAYGRYLAQLGHCGECHSAAKRGVKPEDHPEYFAGSDVAFVTPMGTVYAPNLTGLQDVPTEEIVTALRQGQRLDGEMMLPPMALFAPYHNNVSDEDMAALVAYLKSFSPVDREVPERVVTADGEAFLADAKQRLEAKIAAADEEAAKAAEAEAEAEGEGEGDAAEGDAAEGETAAEGEATEGEGAEDEGSGEADEGDADEAAEGEGDAAEGEGDASE